MSSVELMESKLNKYALIFGKIKSVIEKQNNKLNRNTLYINRILIFLSIIAVIYLITYVYNFWNNPLNSHPCKDIKEEFDINPPEEIPDDSTFVSNNILCNRYDKIDNIIETFSDNKQQCHRP